jgi:hypothetical protein
MKARPSVNLADLAGTHVLSARGVFVSPDRAEWADRDATVVVLRLDGVLYAFHEDPSDGYRSSLASVLVLQPGDIPSGALAVFDPMVVEARLCARITDWSSSRDEVLYFVRESDDLVIAEVGTTNLDDYYPNFHHTWTPEGVRVDYLAPKEDGA